MHYYKRNLGDYAKKAGRLSMLQHGSYTLLIDACYDREQFPTLEEAIDWTWASSTAEIEAVEFVLRKFFVLEDGRYVQKRIQEEIADYHAKSETNARIAAEREANRKAKSTKRARNVDESSPSNHEAPPNQEPLTKNQEPISSVTTVTGGDAAKSTEQLTKAELWTAGKSLLKASGMPQQQCGSFVGKLVKDYGDAIVVDAVRSAVVVQPADPAEYLKATCQRSAGQRQPPNRQIALEDRNRAVAEQWLANEGVAHAAQ
jgi:uncharacterized protein YdaU (DUF1376 family)